MRTRQAVLEAAGEAFAEHGFLGTSMAEILARAGVTKGALYFHFSSKEELALALVEAERAAVARIAEEETARDQPPLRAAVAMTVRWAELVQSDPVVRAGVRLVAEQGTPRCRVPGPCAELERPVAALLRHAAERGELLPEVDPGAAAEVIVAALTGAQVLSRAEPGARDVPRRVEAMWRLLFSGLLPRGREPLPLPRTAV
ncbi:ScbR family autoregulator-binding transcription factor [Streptomyces capparidis]